MNAASHTIAKPARAKASAPKTPKEPVTPFRAALAAFRTLEREVRRLDAAHTAAEAATSAIERENVPYPSILTETFAGISMDIRGKNVTTEPTSYTHTSVKTILESQFQSEERRAAMLEALAAHTAAQREADERTGAAQADAAEQEAHEAYMAAYHRVLDTAAALMAIPTRDPADIKVKRAILKKYGDCDEDRETFLKAMVESLLADDPKPPSGPTGPADLRDLFTEHAAAMAADDGEDGPAYQRLVAAERAINTTRTRSPAAMAAKLAMGWIGAPVGLPPLTPETAPAIAQSRHTLDASIASVYLDLMSCAPTQPQPGPAPCPVAALAPKVDALLAEESAASDDAAATAACDQRCDLSTTISNMTATSIQGAVLQMLLAMERADMVRGCFQREDRDYHHDAFERLMRSAAGVFANYITPGLWEGYVGGAYPTDGPGAPSSDPTAAAYMALRQQAADYGHGLDASRGVGDADPIDETDLAADAMLRTPPVDIAGVRTRLGRIISQAFIDRAGDLDCPHCQHKRETVTAPTTEELCGAGEGHNGGEEAVYRALAALYQDLEPLAGGAPTPAPEESPSAKAWQAAREAYHAAQAASDRYHDPDLDAADPAGSDQALDDVSAAMERWESTPPPTLEALVEVMLASLDFNGFFAARHNTNDPCSYRVLLDGGDTHEIFAARYTLHALRLLKTDHPALATAPISGLFPMVDGYDDAGVFTEDEWRRQCFDVRPYPDRRLELVAWWRTILSDPAQAQRQDIIGPANVRAAHDASALLRPHVAEILTLVEEYEALGGKITLNLDEPRSRGLYTAYPRDPDGRGEEIRRVLHLEENASALTAALQATGRIVTVAAQEVAA